MNDCSAEKRENMRSGEKCEWAGAVQVTYTTTPKLSKVRDGESLTISFLVEFPDEKIQIVEAKVGSKDITINGSIVSVSGPVMLNKDKPIKLGKHDAGATHEGLEGVQISFSKKEDVNQVYFSSGKLIKPKTDGLKGPDSYPLDKVILFQWAPCAKE